MPPLIQLQKLAGIGDVGWKKSVFVLFFGRPEDREFVKKMRFVASYSTSNKLLLVARHILTTDLFKAGSVKFANSLSPPSTERAHRK